MSAPTVYSYERDPRAVQVTTRVVRRGEFSGRRFVVVADTVLFPEGGGQPADRGWIDDIAVLDVQKQAAEVWHFVADFPSAEEVVVRLDWARRFDFMQQHTGQHLLSAIAQDRFGWATTAFHLGESMADVELDVPALDAVQRTALEDAVAAEIRAARAVRARRVGVREFQSLAVRSRGLPEGHLGAIRLVEIEAIDLNTCGGTHLANTAEIESISLIETESMRGGTRLHFLCGQRARRRLAEHETRNRQLREVLGASDETLCRAAEAKIEALREALRRERHWLGVLAHAEALRLAPLATPLAAERFTDRDASFLSEVAKRFIALAPHGVLLLASGNGSEGLVLLSAGPRSTVDVRALGTLLLAELGGRGGGTTRLFQAKVTNLGRWNQALAQLRGAC